MFLALKEMKWAKKRFVLVISVIVLISYLVYFLVGLAYGLAQANRSAIDLWKADGVIMSNAANKNIMASQIDLKEALDIKGGETSPINISRGVIYLKDKPENEKNKDDNMVNVTLMGINHDSFNSPLLKKGHWPKNDLEVICSQEMKEYGVKIGDELELAQNGKKLKVVGYSQPAKYNTVPVIYTKLETSSQAFMMYSDAVKNDGMSITENNSSNNSQQRNIVKPANNINDDSTERMSINSQAQKPQQNQQQVQQQVQQQQNPQVQPKEQMPVIKLPERVNGIVVKDFSSSDIRKLPSNLEYYKIEDYIWNIPGYGPQVLTFGLMIIFLIAISAIIVGIFMYILTIQKKSLFGVMKAQGIPFRMISRSVKWQTFFVSAFGVAIGFGLTYATSLVLPSKVPWLIKDTYIIALTVIMLISAMIGSIFSVKSVKKIDPLDAIE